MDLLFIVTHSAGSWHSYAEEGAGKPDDPRYLRQGRRHNREGEIQC